MTSRIFDFKNPSDKRVFNTCLELASDKTSELYHQTGELQGQERRGAGARCYFWGGYHNEPMAVVPGSLGQACYKAGQAWAKVTIVTTPGVHIKHRVIRGGQHNGCYVTKTNVKTYVVSTGIRATLDTMVEVAGQYHFGTLRDLRTALQEN